MKENIEERPTAKDMNLPDEFVYAARIVEILKNVDLNRECDANESIKIIQKAFIEYKNKILG